MKLAIAVLLVGIPLYGQQLLRPTAEMVPTTCSGNTQNMPNAWDAAGQSTSSSISASATVSCNQYGCTESTASFRRGFGTWAASSFTYTALTLNITSSSPGWQNTTAVGGGAWLYYSINGGATWTQIVADSGTGWPLQTFSITLSPTQDLSKLRVAACVTGNSGGNSSAGVPPPTPGVDTLTISDIWTLGIGTGQGAGTGSTAHGRHNTVIVN